MSRVHESVFSMPVKMISFHVGGGNPSSGLKRPLLFFSGRPGAEPSRAGLVRLGGSDFFCRSPPVRLLTERVVYSKAGLFLQFFFFFFYGLHKKAAGTGDPVIGITRLVQLRSGRGWTRVRALSVSRKDLEREPGAV